MFKWMFRAARETRSITWKLLYVPRRFRIYSLRKSGWRLPYCIDHQFNRPLQCSRQYRLAFKPLLLSLSLSVSVSFFLSLSSICIPRLYYWQIFTYPFTFLSLSSAASSLLIPCLSLAFLPRLYKKLSPPVFLSQAHSDLYLFAWVIYRNTITRTILAILRIVTLCSLFLDWGKR